MSEARRRAYRRKRITEAVILLIGLSIIAVIVTIVATAAEPEQTTISAAPRNWPESAAKTQQAETVGMTASEAAEVSGAYRTAYESIRAENDDSAADRTTVEAMETGAQSHETVADNIVDNVEDTGEGSTDVDTAAGEEEGEPSTETEYVEPPESIYPRSVCGLECEYADYLYYCLALFCRQDFMPYALAQMYQESAFNPAAVGANGHDLGLFQFRDIFWEEYASEAGYPGADIWDPYKQIEVYAYHIDKRIRESADLYTTISDHYTGGKGYAPDYVSAVMQWVKYEE